MALPVSRWPAILLLTGALLAFLAGMWLRMPASMEAGGLTRRCHACYPEWDSYREDLKAGIGARALSEWKGKLLHVRAGNGEASLTFLLESPWTEYPASVPVLLRTPEGRIYRSVHADRDGDIRIWRFTLEEGKAPAWIEVRFPGGEHRLPLDAAGAWESG